MARADRKSLPVRATSESTTLNRLSDPRPGRNPALGRATFLLGLTFLLASAPARAGTTGKLTGRIVDAKKQPLPGVGVAIPQIRSGTATDVDGRYTLLNVPAGTYVVRINLLGYRPVAVQDVVISADNTTKLDQVLGEAPVEMAEVVVTARRPVVDVGLTSSMAALSREEIKTLPVQELQEIVNLQAGVVDGHFRGGRLGEVQYQVDGVTVNNAFDNKSSLKLDRSLIEEVQVISGTFDAEYGQAMSGVVNAVLRRGGERFQWDSEAFGGGFYYPGRGARIVPHDFNPAAVQNFQFTVSGPAPASLWNPGRPLFPKTWYLLSARRSHFDDYVRVAPGAHDRPLGYSHEWSGLAKFTNRSLGPIQLDYQTILNFVEGRKTNWAYRYRPDYLTRQHTVSVVHGLDWTHTLSKNSFYQVSVRQNYLNYRDLLYDDVRDGRYDAAGPPIADNTFLPGAIVRGADFTRFAQVTNALVVKSSLVRQITRDQQLKLGVEMQWPSVRFGAPGSLVFASVNGVQRLVRHYDEPPEFPGVHEYHPVVASAFAQEEGEWNDLKVRGGLRFDYFDARAALPRDLANPANSIPGAPASPLEPTERRVSFAPRIGVSYPITQDAALFFAYGHFSQMPALGQIFQDADYTLLRDLQASSTEYRVMGNPNIRPERTVQYQFGYKQALSDWLGVDLDVFYKDIRDQLGVEFISTYNDAEYARLTNVDFGNVLGFTLAFTQRQWGMLSSRIDYTWQLAQGNSSDPRETATRASAGEDPRPRLVPFTWDQRHTLNVTATLARPDLFSASTIVRVASGQPYTPTIETGFGAGLETNSARKPAGVVVDLRGERNLPLFGQSGSAFIRVFNAFDARFFNGFVFSTSGSPYYSRFPNADRAQLDDPTRFYQPRRVEVGLTLRGSR